MKKETHLIFGNCILGILYLYFRGKIKKVVGISTQISWPYHFICVNDHGHALHFENVEHLECASIIPYWFLGRYVGVSKRKQLYEIERRNRKILFESNKVELLIFFLLMFWIITLPLAIITFGLTYLWHCLYWFAQALTRQRLRA